jgi:hypothetical protein
MLRHAAKHFTLGAFIHKFHSLLAGIFVNDRKDEDGVANSDILLKDESNENHRVSFTEYSVRRTFHVTVWACRCYPQRPATFHQLLSCFSFPEIFLFAISATSVPSGKCPDVSSIQPRPLPLKSLQIQL